MISASRARKRAPTVGRIAGETAYRNARLRVTPGFAGVGSATVGPATRFRHATCSQSGAATEQRRVERQELVNRVTAGLYGYAGARCNGIRGSRQPSESARPRHHSPCSPREWDLGSERLAFLSRGPQKNRQESTGMPEHLQQHHHDIRDRPMHGAVCVPGPRRGRRLAPGSRTCMKRRAPLNPRPRGTCAMETPVCTAVPQGIPIRLAGTEAGVSGLVAALRCLREVDGVVVDWLE